MTKVFFLLSLLFSLAACTQAPAPSVDRSPTAQSRSAGPGEYLVKRGDTLYRIARENGLDYRELAALNNIDNPSALREGQILRLRPVAQGASPAVSAPMAIPIGSGIAIESRPLDAASVLPADSRPNGTLKEPKGGKQPYSDEAHARLNNLAPATPAVQVAAPSSVAATPSAPVSENTGPVQVEGVVWAWPSSAKIKTGYNEAGNKGIDFAGKQGDPVLSAGEGKVLYVGDALAGYGKLVIVRHSADHLSVYAHNSKIFVKEGQAIKIGQKIAEKGSTGTDSVKLHFEIRKQGKPVDPMPFLPKR
jgi:lipoprotein NlpD